MQQHFPEERPAPPPSPSPPLDSPGTPQLPSVAELLAGGLEGEGWPHTYLATSRSAPSSPDNATVSGLVRLVSL